MSDAEIAPIGELAVFRAVYERRSFAAAAADLGLDRSVVSRRIRGLERRLGLALFARNTRVVVPTAPADAFYPRVVDALTMLQEAQSELMSFDGVLRGHVRLAAPAEIGRRFLGPVVCDFLVEHSGVSAEVLLEDKPIDLLHERVDLALRVGTAADSAVIRRLGRSPQVLVAAPSYLRSHPGPEQDLVLSGTGAGPATLDRVVPGHLRPHVTLRLSTNDLFASYDAIRRGVGAGVLPIWLAREDLEAGSLVRLPIPLKLESMLVYVELPAGRRTQHVARAMLDTIAEAWSAAFEPGCSAPH